MPALAIASHSPGNAATVSRLTRKASTRALRSASRGGFVIGL